MALNSIVAKVTERIVERSRGSRRRYLDLIAGQKERGISRPRLSCGNFAHGFAGSGEDQQAIRGLRGPNIGISPLVTPRRTRRRRSALGASCSR